MLVNKLFINLGVLPQWQLTNPQSERKMNLPVSTTTACILFLILFNK